MTAINDFVDFSSEGRIGVITIDSPPVNALSQGVRQGLADGFQAAIADDTVEAIVLICAGRTFIAGADIREFGKPPQPPSLHDVQRIMEDSPKPIVGAVHGTALGGGLETALVCHYRVGDARARFGLPEVKLGILPGAGGTQRLPRIVGVEKALTMITGGTPIGAKEALSVGLIAEIAEDDLRGAAIAFAGRVLDEGRPLAKVRDLDDRIAEARGKPEIFAEFRKSIARKSRGFEAPEACIKCIEAAVELPFEDGLKRERELFLELMAGTQSAAQRYFFFAEREAAKIPDVPKDTPATKIAKAGILGAGTMGGGIAMNFANAGIPVTLLEVDQAALDKGLAVVARNYANTVAKGRLSQSAMDDRMALISGTTDYGDLADADLVIEAVFENMDVKKEVFGKLDAVCKPGAILATNTSTLDINEIATATTRPEAVIGLHFFSPANVMRLLEIVRGAATSKEAIATSMALSKTIGKVGALVGVCDGFVGNRMLAKRGREAEKLILEGAAPQQVDKVLFDFGFPMGPFAMGDLAGLDVGWRIRQARGTPSPVPDTLCEMGRFGQKTGAGYYKYEAGSRAPIPDPVVDEVIAKAAADAGIERREISDQEILERLVYPMINEGALILEEGMAIRASDIDVIWVYGYGWPVYRGGPMFYADTVGVAKVYERICEFRDRFGDDWTPAPLLEKLATEGKGFRDL